MSLFELPIYIMTAGLEDTADIDELHVIAEELGFLPEE